MPNLQFFSVSVIEKMQCQVNNVQALIQSERITYSRGYQMLHDATKDLTTIYYHTTARIGKAHNELTNLRKRGRFLNGAMEAENVLSLASRRSITGMKTAIREYRCGLLTRRQLRRARRLMMDCINQDIASLGQEVSDIIRKTKPEPKKEVDQDWRDIPEKDMTVQRVSVDDDLAQ